MSDEQNQPPKKLAQYRRSEQPKTNPGATDSQASPYKFDTWVYVVLTVFLLAIVVVLQDRINPNSGSRSQLPAQFTFAKSDPGLERMVNEARAQKKPIIIYFYATWCPYCENMKKNFFGNPEIQASLNGITLIGVDASDGTSEQRRMMDRYNVQGFPTLIFYNRNGDIIDNPLKKATHVDSYSDLVMEINNFKIQ